MRSDKPKRLWGGLSWALLALVLNACGGGGSAADEILSGRIAYVDVVEGRQRLFVANTNLATTPSELVIDTISVVPPHEAGDGNLTPDQIERFGRPVWSPDGGRIAVIATRTAGSQLLVVEPTSGRVVTASRQLGEVSFVDWSADGQSLAYVEELGEDTPPRIVTTFVETGATTTLMSVDGRLLDALRWDESSSGIYCSYRETISSQRLLLRIDVPAGQEQFIGNLPNGEFQDIWRDLTLVYSAGDNEFESLGTSDFSGDENGYVGASAPSDGRYVGWFSSASSDLVAVEQLVNRGNEILLRQRPFLAKPDLDTPVEQREYVRFPVNAPVPLKWDFSEQ